MKLSNLIVIAPLLVAAGAGCQSKRGTTAEAAPVGTASSKSGKPATTDQPSSGDAPAGANRSQLPRVEPTRKEGVVPFGDIQLQLELGKWTPAEINQLLTEARANGRDHNQRVEYLLERFKGTRFEYESQLEMPAKNTLRVRLESFGCTGFGIYLLALASAHDFEEFAHNLRVIRYWQTEERGVHSDPARGNVLDFAWTIFAENALARGFVKDVTAEVAGTNPLTTFKTRFTARRRSDEYDKSKRMIVPKVHQGEIVEAKMLSRETFTKMDRSKIRTGDLLLFSRVKPSEPMSDVLMVGHVGIARNEGGEIYLAHATRDYVWRPEAKSGSPPHGTGVLYLDDPRREQLGVSFATTWVTDPAGRKIKIDGKSYYGYHPSEKRPLYDYLIGANINGILVLRPTERPAELRAADEAFRKQGKRLVPGAAPGEQPVVDSAMNEAEAIRTNLPAHAPAALIAQLAVVDVSYPGTDGKLHAGQLVVHEEVVQDVHALFALIRKERYAVTSVIPISHQKYLKDGRWDDESSMSVNNTSAFNFRVIKGSKKLSSHACGKAIDLNPKINPYINGTTIQPANGSYDPAVPGTLTPSHPIVLKMKSLGWTWGGDFKSLKDYQHFEKGCGVTLPGPKTK